MSDAPAHVVGERFFKELADFAPVMIWRKVLRAQPAPEQVVAN